MLQLGDGHLAEDAVQEALIGALKNAASFGGRAALKIWIFAILKNKIADTLRHKQRVLNASSLLREEDDDEALFELFDRKGFWQQDERPVAWGNPEASLRDTHFWHVFEACLDTLTAQTGASIHDAGIYRAECRRNLCCHEFNHQQPACVVVSRTSAFARVH